MFKRVFRIFSSGKSKGKAKDKAKASEAEVNTETAAGRYQQLRESGGSLPANATPEKLCGITKGMKEEEIEKQLTELYRRHNRAASSLDLKLRDEAEMMLDAIVELRMKYLAPTGTKE